MSYTDELAALHPASRLVLGDRGSFLLGHGKTGDAFGEIEDPLESVEDLYLHAGRWLCAPEHLR